MARNDLLDQLDAVMPRVDPADGARQILAVMARICGAGSSAVLFESGNVLRWLAGDSLSDEVAAMIQRAWRVQSARVLTGTAFTESRAESNGAIGFRLLWIRGPADGGLDAVYFAGRGLRPLEACGPGLARLAALLGRLHSGWDDHPREKSRKSDTLMG